MTVPETPLAVERPLPRPEDIKMIVSDVDGKRPLSARAARS